MSMTFTKLFSSITESTIWVEDHETRIVWIAMLAMADRKGRIWGSIPGLANRARVSVDGCRKAIALFLSPDPDSRTKVADGRRIEEIDGGWQLINYDKYREIRDQETIKEQTANRVRKHRNVKRNVTPVTHGNANAEEEAEVPITTANAVVGEIRGLPPCPYEQIVNLYHSELPTLRRVARLTPARKSQIKARWNEDNQDLDGWRDFFRFISESDFLMGRAAARKDSASPFQADLDWITKAANWIKIVEGKYHHG